MAVPLKNVQNLTPYHIYYSHRHHSRRSLSSAFLPPPWPRCILHTAASISCQSDHVAPLASHPTAFRLPQRTIPDLHGGPLALHDLLSLPSPISVFLTQTHLLFRSRWTPLGSLNMLRYCYRPLRTRIVSVWMAAGFTSFRSLRMTRSQAFPKHPTLNRPRHGLSLSLHFVFTAFHTS